MNNINKYIKKEKWFKIGKWKEPVFLQDTVVRSYLKQKISGALPYYPKIYFVAGFQQFMRLKEFNTLKKKIKAALTHDHLEIARQIEKEIYNAIRNLDSFNPKKLNKNTINRYSSLVEVHARQSLRFIIMGYALEEMYPKLLPKNLSLRKKQFTPQSLLAAVALPKKVMPMIAENIDRLKIATALKQGKPVATAVREHVKKFSWMNSICWWDEPFSAEHYWHEARRLAKGNPQKRLKEIILGRKKQYQTAANILSELKKRYPLTWEYINVIRDMTDMREESWDAVSRAGVRLRPLFKKLAGQNHISYNQLMMMSINEMLDLAKGKLVIGVDELNQRLNSFAIFSKTAIINKPFIYSGRTAKRLLTIIEGKSQKISSFTGLTIWPGIAQGTARVLKSADEIGKMRKKEILVCPMTDPDYMPAIIKAKGIVTDQGGLLCHAAIIARELKKVCIVGTQIATKVIKDGDQIEVNANEGIIKRLN